MIDADNKRCARLNVIGHLPSAIPYGELDHEHIGLPPRRQRACARPPIDSQSRVPKRHVVS